jgi:hypothetical protein
VQRPTMKFVATKTADQLDLQALHRIANGQVRGLLDIFGGAASIEGCVLRPIWVSYS